MLADQLIAYVTDVGFLFIFVVVLTDLVRQPRRTTADSALFFGAVALIVALSAGNTVLRHGAAAPALVTDVIIAALLALPYLLLRLVDDFAGIPRYLTPVVLVGLLAGIVGFLVLPTPYSIVYVLAIVAYFVAVQAYCTWRFMQAIGQTAGATRRRMQAVAIGSCLLALVLVIAGLQALFPAAAPFWRVCSRVVGLACALGYFIGFAPPRSLLRLWQATAIREFLAASLGFPPDADIDELTESLEEAIAASVGAPHAMISLWDEPTQRLVAPRFAHREPIPSAQRDSSVAFRAWRQQRPFAFADSLAADPKNAERYIEFGARAVLVAPITVGPRRYGVLSAYAERPSIFAHDDLSLLALLAEETALVLHRRELALAAAEVQAHEETTRLKDEFLSAAAHDLRTPLTIILAQGQLLQRHMRRRGDPAGDDLAGVDRVVEEAQRMRRLTDDLLDASRSTAAGFVGDLVPADIVELAREVAASVDSPRHSVQVEGSGVIGLVDPERIRQVLQNLVDNAVKFSPHGGMVCIECRTASDAIHITVSDEGIGIPADELPHLFERFYRGSSVGGRGFAGMGIGLYLCKRIVDEHRGLISAESVPGAGSRFQVVLPLEME